MLTKLEKQLLSERKIIGYNQDDLNRTIIITGSPREYNYDKVCYINQKRMSEEKYLRKKLSRKG